MKPHTAWLVLIVLVLATGCGERQSPRVENGNETPLVAAEESAPAPLDLRPDARPWNPALGTASLKGRAIFRGPPPVRRALDLSRDPACRAMHGEPLLDESVIVARDGSIRNIFVRVESGLEGWRFPIPQEPRVLDQQLCVYVPHVTGIQAGQWLEIRNSDAVTHNVHCTPELSQGFNLYQKPGHVDRRRFHRTEVPIAVKCDLHPWMGAWVCVTLHPFWDVSGPDGAFEILGLPPGTYTIEAWHETLGRQRQTVTLSDGETKHLGFTFKPRRVGGVGDPYGP